MGSTTSQLQTVQFLWPRKVGPYARKMTRKRPKSAKNGQKGPFLKIFKMLKLNATFNTFAETWQLARPQEYKQNLFFGFLILWHFWAILGHFDPKNGVFHFFGLKWPRMAQKCQNIKNPKNKFCLYSWGLANCQVSSEVLKVVLSFFFLKIFKKGPFCPFLALFGRFRVILRA